MFVKFKRVDGFPLVRVTVCDQHLNVQRILSFTQIERGGISLLSKCVDEMTEDLEKFREFNFYETDNSDSKRPEHEKG